MIHQTQNGFAADFKSRYHREWALFGTPISGFQKYYTLFIPPMGKVHCGILFGSMLSTIAENWDFGDNGDFFTFKNESAPVTIPFELCYWLGYQKDSQGFIDNVRFWNFWKIPKNGRLMVQKPNFTKPCITFLCQLISESLTHQNSSLNLGKLLAPILGWALKKWKNQFFHYINTT